MVSSLTAGLLLNVLAIDSPSIKLWKKSVNKKGIEATIPWFEGVSLTFEFLFFFFLVFLRFILSSKGQFQCTVSNNSLISKSNIYLQLSNWHKRSNVQNTEIPRANTHQSILFMTPHQIPYWISQFSTSLWLGNSITMSNKASPTRQLALARTRSLNIKLSGSILIGKWLKFWFLKGSFLT